MDSGPYPFKAQGPRIIENFLDVGHFPFVHAGFLGDPSHTEVGDYEVETTSDGVVARISEFGSPTLMHGEIRGGEVHIPGAAPVDCVLSEISQRSEVLHTQFRSPADSTNRNILTAYSVLVLALSCSSSVPTMRS